MIIREAQKNDLAHVSLLGSEFLEESNWLGTLTLDKDKIYSTLLHMYNDPNHILAVAFEEEGTSYKRLQGFTMWSLENPWTVEKIAIEILFYVNPEYRGKNVAKPLLDFAVNICENKGARMLYSSSTAGFDDDGRTARAYNILLRRAGFKELSESRFLVKDLGVSNGKSS